MTAEDKFKLFWKVFNKSTRRKLTSIGLDCSCWKAKIDCRWLIEWIMMISSSRELFSEYIFSKFHFFLFNTHQNEMTVAAYFGLLCRWFGEVFVVQMKSHWWQKNLHFYIHLENFWRAWTREDNRKVSIKMFSLLKKKKEKTVKIFLPLRRMIASWEHSR